MISRKAVLRSIRDNAAMSTGLSMLLVLALIVFYLAVGMPTFDRTAKSMEANVIADYVARLMQTAALATEQGYSVAPGTLTVERAKKWPHEPSNPYFVEEVTDLWNMGAPVKIVTKPQHGGGPPLFMIVAQKPVEHVLSLPDIPPADAISQPGSYREVVGYYDGTLRQMPVPAPPSPSRRTASFMRNPLGWVVFFAIGAILMCIAVVVIPRVQERMRLGKPASNALKFAACIVWIAAISAHPLPIEGAPLADFAKGGILAGVALAAMLVSMSNWSGDEAAATR